MFTCFSIEGKIFLQIEQLKQDKKNRQNIRIFSSLFTSEKSKRKFFATVTYFSYIEYAMIISLFLNGSNNKIIDIQKQTPELFYEKSCS